MLLPSANVMNSIFGESLFDDFFEDFARPMRTASRYNTTTGIMRTDVKESDTSYELDIDLPGYKKENVKAELENGYLTINAETSQNNDQKDEDGKYIRRERYYGTCSRRFYVGEEVNQEDIKAKFEDGILKVSVPKKEIKPVVEERKYIPIEG
ncbi:MAG TPA: Hsp20/alpha crystallin family protein [Lachnospiraceae bacterium]|jgi:HSP20 family molecular chaperone IbpA|nr:Hsp20/alpha crystallin family protein [Lachnospiraceae bacterium]